MEPSPLKLVTIITEAAIERDLVNALKSLGATGYTITDARGRGHRGVRASSWEFGANIRIEVVCEEKLADAIAGHLWEHYYENYAMILFLSDVQVLRPRKFQSGGTS